TISTSVPPPPENDVETPLASFHPCATRGPSPPPDADNTSDAVAKDLHNLVERCQRHRHAGTCYKYWKGHPDPKECRFDLDESNVRSISVFDPETGEFHLRCLDGLVNNFNLTMIQAIRCNMDIKFIGSGPSAKAILYYITDYITKSQLKAHVAYAALELAVNKLGEFHPEEDDLSARARKLLQKCAHSMISSQELSSQQVVSYLMDFEDHFTSHQYNNLYWTSFDGFINSEDPSPECYPKKSVPSPADVERDILDVTEEQEDDEDILAVPDEEDDKGAMVADMDTVTLDPNPAGVFVATANQVCDYQWRGGALQDV
ncbi:hypothetical protein FB451DRAFT_954590, partial [Mycena latifolia]